MTAMRAFLSEAETLYLKFKKGHMPLLLLIIRGICPYAVVHASALYYYAFMNLDLPNFLSISSGSEIMLLRGDSLGEVRG